MPAYMCRFAALYEGRWSSSRHFQSVYSQYVSRILQYIMGTATSRSPAAAHARGSWKYWLKPCDEFQLHLSWKIPHTAADSTAVERAKVTLSRVSATAALT